MGIKLPPREAELYKRCDEVLHYLWDPIGVADAPGARDEYHFYLPQVFALVGDNADPGRIEEYLATVVKDRMGLWPDRKRDRSVVEVLMKRRKWIWENAAYQDAAVDGR